MVETVQSNTSFFSLQDKEAINQSTPIDDFKDIGNTLRRDSVEMTTTAASGHPTSCASMADIAAVLWFHPNGLHYDPKDPKQFSSDRFLLSKGHAAPLLYAVWAHAGYLEHSKLRTLKQLGSPLTGHPSPTVPFVDVASGSLGQGLSVTMGMAYASKYIDKIENKFFAMLGDAEIAEGQIWEACDFGARYKLDNVIAFVDVNRLGQSGSTMFNHQVENYKKKFEAFGCKAICIDGHDIAEIILALDWARKIQGTPAVIIAKTFKGKGLGPLFEDKDWHGKPLAGETETTVSYLSSIISSTNWKVEPSKPSFDFQKPESKGYVLPPLSYAKGEVASIEEACGNAYRTLAEADETKLIYAVDKDAATSKSSFNFAGVAERFVSCNAAEQNMVCVAQGLSARGKIPFCSTFGASFTRAFDQIRLVGISDSNVKFIGSNNGLTGSEGPSHRGLDDLTMFRSVTNSVVLYPSDAVSAERAFEIAANHKGLVYIRTNKYVALPVLYNNDEKFELGKAKVIKQTDKDVLTIVTSGVSLDQALVASQKLALEGIHARVVDLFSVKPVDVETLVTSAKATSSHKILTIDEHYPEGGINGAVSGALSETHIKVYAIAVDSTPVSSGNPKDLLHQFNLSAEKIEAYVKSIL